MDSKGLVIVDIDGTLIRGQSQQILLDFLFKGGTINLFNYIVIYSWFVMYKLGLTNNPKKVMEFAFKFLSGMKTEEVDSVLDIFLKKELTMRFLKPMISIVDTHKKEGREIILLSNVIEPLVRKISEYLKVDNYISTKLILDGETYTGEIDGKIIYGKEKLFAVKEFIKTKGYTPSDCWAYADHRSDMSLLEFVGNPNAVNPDKVLKQNSLKKGWRILNFT